VITLAAEVCDPEDWLCTNVHDATGNAWLAQAADWMIAKPVAIAGLLLVAFLLRWVAAKLIDRLARRAATGVVPERLAGRPPPARRADVSAQAAAARRVQRAQTTASVLKSIASFVIFSVVTIMVIAELGYDVAPLIAGAGIVGLALGFGAQNLVKDFLSGIFLAFEDQIGVGDQVEVNEVTGVVEALTLRVTRLRDEDGTIWYVRNGEILKVGNHSQG
jgi:small conductance mechanosensitive channel